MKKFYLIALFSISITSIYGQQVTGGLHANVGVDGDTKASFKKFGPVSNNTLQDDWFSTGSLGKAIISEQDALSLKTQLQAGKNMSFFRPMSVPAFSNVDGRLWMEGVYMRDFVRGTKKDSTAFYSGKVGQNPAAWQGANMAVTNNSDIVDAYAHFRRNGTTIQDSLWLFAGISTVGTGSERYTDIELYAKDLSYNRSNGNFTSAGLSQGRTEWLFDALGNVIQTGDVLITVRFNGTNKPVVDIHLWISYFTYYSGNPSKFKFGSKYHYGGTGMHGYVNILPKSATTITGSVISNRGPSVTTDTTFSTPWGTIKSTGTWSQNYDSKQFAEIGLNLTRIGIDPSLYALTQNNSCGPIFKSILFKAGSYNTAGREVASRDDDDHNSCYDQSEDVDLEDFVGPYSLGTPVITFNLTVSDTITCKKPIGKIKLNQASSSAAHYAWSTLDGEIDGTENNNKTVRVKKKGWYTVNASVAPGCPIAKTELIFVPEDDHKPIASAAIEWTDMGEPMLKGGDTVLSNLLTPFGKSKGLEYKWTGPDGFVSTEQNVIVPWEYAWGSFEVSVKEKRNGCEDVTSVEFAFRSPEGTNSGPTGPTIELRNTALWYYNGNVHINAPQEKAGYGKIVVFNLNGQMEMEKAFKLNKGRNRFQISALPTRGMRVVMLYANGQLLKTEKIVF